MRRAVIANRVSRATSRVDRYKTPLGLLVLAFAAFLAYVAFISTTGPPFQSKYQIEVTVPAGAPVVRKGQAVRISGKLAGLISDVEPDREAGATRVTANITKTEFRPLPDDTTAYVRVHSLVYETWLELRPGDSQGMLADGDTLKAPATHGVDLLEVVQLFDKQTRTALQDSLVNVGFGVAGRGSGANQALADLPDLARNSSRELPALTPRPGALGEVISGGAQTARGLRGRRDDDVAALLDSGAAAVGTIAERRQALRQSLQRLRPFEDQFLHTAPTADPLLHEVTRLSADLRPSVRALHDQLPDLNRLLALGSTLRDESERITAVADPALAAARPVAFGLFPTSTALKPLNADLKALKATVKPYQAEIAQSGRRLADATSVHFPGGLAADAPALRVVPVLTPHRCQDPLPDPGQAQGERCP